MSSSDDEPPPLQDMSNHFQQKIPKQMKNSGLIDGENRTEVATIITEPEIKKVQPKKQENKNSNKNKNFGGMSKGFFNSKPKPVKKKVVRKKVAESKKNDNEDEIIELSANTLVKEPKSSLVFEEVQKANPAAKMAEMIEKSKKDWCNDNLLSKFEKDKELTDALKDPAVSEALAKFQSNPKEALEYYKKHDPSKIQLMLKCAGVLGNHMENLDDRKNERDRILKKEKIKNLVEYLKTRPDRAQYYLRENQSDLEFKNDVQTLLASGDLKMDGIV